MYWLVWMLLCACSYTGEWKGSKKNGKGKLILASGDEYEGDFKDDERTGFGVMKYNAV